VIATADPTTPLVGEKLATAGAGGPVSVNDQISL
jgi:hypothetical protein